MTGPPLLRDLTRLLPHGRPFLFVDEVVAYGARRVTARRAVPVEEPWTAAHFPGDPLVPGVLLLEGMVQTAALLGRLTGTDTSSGHGRLAAVRSARFREVVRPGADLTYEADLKLRAGPLWQFDARTRSAEGTVVAEASVVLLLGLPAPARSGGDSA